MNFLTKDANFTSTQIRTAPNRSQTADLTFSEVFGFGTDFGQRYHEETERDESPDILNGLPHIVFYLIDISRLCSELKNYLIPFWT